MASPLLQTKLQIPPVRPNLVARPDLLARLDQGLTLGRRLTLVSAAAGAGKTTLLSQWVHGLMAAPGAGAGKPGPTARVAWLSLDEADNDPARFLAYLVAALGRAAPGFGQSMETVGGVTSPASCWHTTAMTAVALLPATSQARTRRV